MDIQVNGEPRSVPEGMTVAGLLRDLEIESNRVVVEVTLEIVDRQQFEHRTLREGDRIEILSFIGGGTAECVTPWPRDRSQKLSSGLGLMQEDVLPMRSITRSFQEGIPRSPDCEITHSPSILEGAPCRMIL